jgi:hypothetical protein
MKVRSEKTLYDALALVKLYHGDVLKSIQYAWDIISPFYELTRSPYDKLVAVYTNIERLKQDNSLIYFGKNVRVITQFNMEDAKRWELDVDDVMKRSNQVGANNVISALNDCQDSYELVDDAKKMYHLVSQEYHDCLMELIRTPSLKQDPCVYDVGKFTDGEWKSNGVYLSYADAVKNKKGGTVIVREITHLSSVIFGSFTPFQV